MAKKKKVTSQKSKKSGSAATAKRKTTATAAKKKPASTAVKKKIQKVKPAPAKPVKKAAPKTKTAKATKAAKTARTAKPKTKTAARPATPAVSPLPWLNKTHTAAGQAEKVLPIKLTAKIKNDFRKKLLSLREEVSKQIAFLATDNINRTKSDAEMDYHSEEQGTDNFNRDFALNRVSSEQEVIFEIDEALNRLQVGGFGVCEGCSGGIEKERIHALPHTKMCITCQSGMEKKRKHFRPFNNGALFSTGDEEPIQSSDDDN